MAYAVDLLSNLLSGKNKNIYCFGAGKVLDALIKEYADYKVEKKIKAVVDNNINVVRMRKKVINNSNILIISFAEMIDKIKKQDVILITTAAYEEIITQIEMTRELEDIKYYIYLVLRIEQYDYDRLSVTIPEKLSLYKNIQIPKTIHYCWFGKNKIPPQYIKWMKSWKQYCPNYEIIEWNENNYDVNKNKYISQAYKMGKWAFVSDYARIDIINEYGGLYLDVDVELIKNIDELLMNDAFCGFESKEYVAYGLGFGSKKNNSILYEIKEYYERSDFIQNNGVLDQTSCPLIQTEIMKKYGLKCNGEFQTVGGMTVYPSRVLCGMSPHSFRIEKNLTYTYAIHHFEGSWVEDKREKNTLISSMKKWGKDSDYVYLDS